jgi:hypothetical protein
VTVAEKKDEASSGDALGAKLSRFLDDIGLRFFQAIQQMHRLVVEGESRWFADGAVDDRVTHRYFRLLCREEQYSENVGCPGGRLSAIVM